MIMIYCQHCRKPTTASKITLDIGFMAITQLQCDMCHLPIETKLKDKDVIIFDLGNNKTVLKKKTKPTKSKKR